MDMLDMGPTRRLLRSVVDRLSLRTRVCFLTIGAGITIHDLRDEGEEEQQQEQEELGEEGEGEDDDEGDDRCDEVEEDVTSETLAWSTEIHSATRRMPDLRHDPNPKQDQNGAVPSTSSAFPSPPDGIRVDDFHRLWHRRSQVGTDDDDYR